MVYLDYSATTKVSDEVLDSFIKATKYSGNPNSLHKLGSDALGLIDASTKQIAKLLGVDKSEVIYTSGASESNNTAIKGVCFAHPNKKHIITTPLEHSSIYGPINYLVDLGYSVDFVKIKENGLVDIDNLKELINDDTILVSIGCVNSEIGIRQPVEEIGNLLKGYKQIYFHSDLTQAIGKCKVDLTNIDLASFSGHKIFGIKGSGCLIKKKSVSITPLIHGGKSTTSYRSGTPATELIVSLSKALRIALEEIDKKYEYVSELNSYLKDKLSKYENVFINSNKYSIPHVLNLSVVGIKPEVMQHALEEYEIYISTQSACSVSTTSKAVMAVTNSKDRASSSIRVSLSYKTTKEELDYFIKYFDICYKKLRSIRNGSN